jgi:hypothetical protein
MKRKLFPVLATILMVFSVLALAIPAIPAFAAGAILLTPLTGTVGSATTISGSGLGSATLASISYDSVVIAANVPIASGAFVRYITIPESVKGPHTVTVTTNLPETMSTTFTVTPGIQLSPVSGGIGSQVSISGTGYPANQLFTASFGLTALSAPTGYTNALGSFLGQFTVPNYPAGSYSVYGSTPSDSAITTFAVAPSITLSSQSGFVGGQISLTGIGFMASGTAYLYYDAASILNTTTNTGGGIAAISFTIPEGVAGNGHTVRMTDALGNTSTVVFTINPQITVSTTTLAPGDEFSFSGKGFSASSQISILLDNTPINLTVSSNTLGTIPNAFVKPPAISAGAHTLRISDSSGQFAVANLNSTSQLSISPSGGVVGSKAELTGVGFKANSVVSVTLNGALVNTTPATITDSIGNFRSAFTVPGTAAGTYNVTASDGLGSASTKFSTAPIALPTGVSTGPVGTSIPISGLGFISYSLISVKFDNVSVGTTKADENGGFLFNLTLPASTAGIHKVTASDGTNSLVFDVTVTPSAGISLTSGFIGSSVTATGAAFAASGTVKITFDSQSVASVSADNAGSFTASFVVTTTQSGNHTITVTDGAITKTFAFKLVADVPGSPNNVYPAVGAKADNPAKFQWNAVTSKNGAIVYEFQIASDVGFNTIIIDKKGLSVGAYELTTQEKLKSAGKKNPYYWRVRATNAAGDTGDWSTASSFTVGFEFPNWLIYLIIGVGAVIVLGIGFLIGRKTR